MDRTLIWRVILVAGLLLVVLGVTYLVTGRYRFINDAGPGITRVDRFTGEVCLMVGGEVVRCSRP